MGLVFLCMLRVFKTFVSSNLKYNLMTGLSESKFDLAGPGAGGVTSRPRKVHSTEKFYWIITCI